MVEQQQEQSNEKAKRFKQPRENYLIADRLCSVEDWHFHLGITSLARNRSKLLNFLSHYISSSAKPRYLIISIHVRVEYKAHA
jgi:hypothetical protein